ncbi:unnamed protein product [Orchesella dallaii]|uniref:RanBP2-type domain-containing protein n=1 Tax=Orchesella dallaii TaxID=48710 RepID=A0ABP1R5P0_9HEXA
MDGRFPSSSSNHHHHHSTAPPEARPPNLRSSVSMFIEDSRITAVANAEMGPPPQSAPHFRGVSGATPCSSGFGGSSHPSSSHPTSFYSVTSFTSGPPSASSHSAAATFNLRPTFCQISTTLPDPVTHSGSIHSSPVRSRACSASPVRFSRQSSGGGGCGGGGGLSGSREIIHKIIREEGTLIDNETEPNFHHPLRHPQPPPPPDASTRLPPPPPPSSTSFQRRRATLNVEPVISIINVKETVGGASHRMRDDRAYTSVNLTLRSPSTPPGSTSGGGATLITRGGVGVDPPPSTSTSTSNPPNLQNVNVLNVNTVVDMEAGPSGTSFRHVHTNHHPSSHHHAPTNLMYSTYSNSRDGFEAQVQIQFGPHGGTFTASRRRNHNISMRQMNSDLLSAQTERKDKLRTAIQDRKHLLSKLQTEIAQLRSQLQLNPFSELEKLKQENQRLRIECDFMAREVDLYENGSVPLGETSEEFYQGINPGQSVDALFGITNNRRKIGNAPPPRPPPPKFLQSPDATTNNPAGRSPDGEWRCSMCTFQNHRDLDFCEQCQMVRVKHGPS